MKKHIIEKGVLFASVIKWLLLSAVIGLLVGLAATLFIKLLNLGIKFTSTIPYYYLLLPLALVASALIIHYLAPDAHGHGTEKVIETIHKNSGKSKAAVVPIKLLTTIITLMFGGSAGKEGPCAQIGAGIASIFADIFKLSDNDRKKIVICGISAGFAAIFGTPVAGAIFGVEVLFVGAVLYEVLLPSFIAGITAYIVSTSAGVNYYYHPINISNVLNEKLILQVILAAIFFGLCAWLLIEIMEAGKWLSDKIKCWIGFKALLAGLLLIGLTFIFSPKYLGLGLDTIEACIEGQPIEWLAIIIKPIFSSITLNFGGSGGIITPVFFTGAAAGSVFAQVFGLSIKFFTAIGLVSVLAGATNAPIAASILAIELFGSNIAPYAAIACVISFIMTGHRSVYPSQVVSIKKSASLDINIGQEITDIEVKYKVPKKPDWLSLITKFNPFDK